jgi:hypothetical protein
MAYRGTKPFDVPGLNKTLKVQDLEESRNIYNVLPDDSQQPEILESHIHNLAALFVRNRANGIFGIHLAHAHFAIPENTAILGVNYNEPHCRWARTTAIQAISLSNVHGHIFVLTDHGFHPYEYQTGPIPDLSGVNSAFLPELADYLNTNNLSTLVGLQIIDQNPVHMLELILPQGTIMLDVSNLNGCVPTRQTGWKFESEDGEPRVCQANETHGRTATKHEIYNKGDPHPKLEDFQDLKNALVEAEILCI